MKLTFLGAAGTVTGSKYLIEANGARVLEELGWPCWVPDYREEVDLR